nr:restriction endonuclease subunit S [Moritella viscosa]SHN95954.1 Type II restriction-modification enzyme [Moritella viscosa]
MSNLIPDGWSENKIGNIASVFAGGTPSRSNLNYYIGSIPWVKSGEVNARQIYSTNEHISELAVKESSAKWAPSGSILVAMYGATAGKVSKLMINATLNQAVSAINCHDGIANNDYLLQAIEFNTEELLNTVQGSGQPNLSGQLIKGLSLLFPPLPEQQKIAAILTSVDDVIEKTQAQIDKLKDLKTGMMQELLTRGVGVDGKPHTEFKDSPVGRIPKGWDVLQLSELASFVTSGSRGWAQYYSESGAIFIRIGNLTREHINFRFKDTIYVTPPNSAEGKRTLVQTGDVLISITADLGVIAVVNDDIGEAYVNQHVSLVRLNDLKISRWVGHFLSFEESQKQFTANNDSGAKAGLNLTAIRNMQVALPPIQEMNQIVKALDSIDSSIAMKRTKLAKITDTKKALMQDLLTGKVRVKLDS